MSVIDTLAHEYGWSDQSILSLTIAKARAFLDAANARRKGEFRRAISLTEWSTRLIAQTQAATAMGDTGSLQKDVAKATFPWYEDSEEAEVHKALTEDDDLSFLETGDLSAADKNAGKTLPSFGNIR